MKSRSMQKTTIIDEFTFLPVSRQRKKQLRYARDKKCVSCGSSELVTKKHCKIHAEQANWITRRAMLKVRSVSKLKEEEIEIL